jgi:septum formation protein
MSNRSLTLYLASKSPRRRELIRHCGLAVRHARSRYEEKPARPSVNPRALVRRHALGKAREAILPKVSKAHRLVLGADTIVVCKKRILGKPKNRRQAARMLEALSGKTHSVLTGLALIDPASGENIIGVARTRVRFKKLDQGAIGRYLQSVNTLDKAGSYAIQEGPRIIRSIQGSRTNVIGLPLELLKDQIKKARKWFPQ